MIKYIVYIKILFFITSTCYSSSLQNAIKIRLQLQDVLGSKIIVVNETNNHQVDLKINEVLQINLRQGTFHKDVYQSKIPINQISLDYFKSQKILWTETLDSGGFYKSTLYKNVEKSRYSTKEYEAFLLKIQSDIKNSYIISGSDHLLNNNDEDNYSKFDNSIIKIGLLLESNSGEEALSIKEILKGSIATEFGFAQGDLIKSAWSDNIGASLNNVINYRFDDKSNFINFNVERSGESIKITILKPSLMEAVLYSK